MIWLNFEGVVSSHLLSSTSVPVLSKGEKTRQKILRATLRVIELSGRRGVTHRAVAKEAGVSLSLTTHYFKDMSELLIEAFRLHKQELHDQLAPSLALYDEEVLQVQHCREQGDELGAQQAIELIAQQLTDLVLEQVTHRSQGLVVEMAFFFDIHMSESFREAAYELRQRFVDDIAALCTTLGSQSPASDAEIIIGTIQRLQYEVLSVPNYTCEQKVRQQLRRLLLALWCDS